MASRFSTHLTVSTAVLSLALAACGGSPAASPAPTTSTAPTASPTRIATPPRDGADGCVEEHVPGTDYFPDHVTFEHATGVSVEYAETYKTVTVTRPWEGAEEPWTYVLYQCGTPVPDVNAEDAIVVEVPIQRAVTQSTTHLPSFDLLGAVDTLVGVGTASFVYTPSVRAALDAGDIVEVGEGATSDIERLVDLDPDIVMRYSFGGLDDDGVRTMQQAGLTVVLNGEYVENEPLGRAEWLKFVALFLNREAEANELFGGIADEYQRLAGLAADVAADAQPSTFLNVPFEGVWYMPGSENYMARLLEDARASYLWAGEEGSAAGTGSLELDIEAVLERAGDADLWLNAGVFYASLADISAVDERLGDFAAFGSGQVWSNDARTSADGGIDFYETAVVRPDWVLADLIAIVHPDLLPDHELTFYRQIPTSPSPTGSPT